MNVFKIGEKGKQNRGEINRVGGDETKGEKAITVD